MCTRLFLENRIMEIKGAALAAEKLGVVSVVNAEKGTLLLRDGTRFENVEGSLLRGLKREDKVKVDYKEEGGKRTVTSITPPAVGC